MASASMATIDFGERTNAAVTMFNADKFAERERELTTLLIIDIIPKCHIILAECQENRHAAEVFYDHDSCELIVSDAYKENFRLQKT